MFIPDPTFSHQGFEFFPSKIKEFKYFNPKKLFIKLSEIWSGLFIPDPYPDFLPIPDPGVKKAPDPGSGTLMYWTHTAMNNIISRMLA